MVFSTALFLFLFLPMFLAGYYLIPPKARSAWILLGSWVFYGWWRLDFLFLLILTSVWNYALGRMIDDGQIRASRTTARNALVLGLILNLGSLAYFKYFNFAMDSVNSLLGVLGAEALQTWSVILPIGISFYIFQASSYLIDVYRRDASAARNFVDLAAYIALFPQLIAGPILRYKDLSEQFVHRQHSFDMFSQGSYRFMYGFAKKVLIADTVAVIADTAFALEAPGFAGAWLGTLAYTSQLYFDFSGYSDMAIGLGLMMGFRFMENFNHPYISRSITEFWRRWHISLSTWLRDYLYIPLGGNRKGRRTSYRNILLVMLLGGLWHGAAWNFVIWGLWHAVLMMSERMPGERMPGERMRRESRDGRDSRDSLSRGHRSSSQHDGQDQQDQRDGQDQQDQRGHRDATSGDRPATLKDSIAVLRTFLLVILGWVVFRAPDMAGAGRIYAGMFGLQGSGQFETLLAEIGLLAPVVLAVSFVVMFRNLWLGGILPRPYPADAPAGASFGASAGASAGAILYVRLLIMPMFLLAIIKLLAESHSPFLYFQF